MLWKYNILICICMLSRSACGITEMNTPTLHNKLNVVGNLVAEKYRAVKSRASRTVLGYKMIGTSSSHDENETAVQPDGAINKNERATRFNRPVQPLVPFVSGSAAEILGPAGARRDLEAVGPAEETRMQRRHRREVHRGHRLTAQQRLVRTTSPETGAPLLLPLKLRYALRPLQRVRTERPFREEVLQIRKDNLD